MGLVQRDCRWRRQRAGLLALVAMAGLVLGAGELLGAPTAQDYAQGRVSAASIAAQSGTAIWAPDGGSSASGKPTGIWYLPDGRSLAGPVSWSQQDVSAASQGYPPAVDSTPIARATEDAPLQPAQTGTLTTREALSALFYALLATVGAGILTLFVFRSIAAQLPVTREKKQLAWASVTAMPAYMVFLSDAYQGRLGVASIGPLIGLGLWPIMFMGGVVVFWFFRRRFGNPADVPRTPGRPAGGAAAGVNPQDTLDLAKPFSMATTQPAERQLAGPKNMNSDQGKIVVFALFVISAVLFLIFIRLGSALDYSRSIMILPLSEVPNPNAYLPFQKATYRWGVLARSGSLGVILGLIIPLALSFTALFIKRAD